MAVQVEVQHEAARQFVSLLELFGEIAVVQVGSGSDAVTGEAGGGVVALLPGAVFFLRLTKILDAAEQRRPVLITEAIFS